MGYNSAFTVVNRRTQQVRILPCVLGVGEMSSEATAKLFFEAVVRFYGLPDEVLHDRDPRFTADFWHDSGSCWEAGQCSHHLTTHRLMGELRECTALSSRLSDVC